MSDSEVINETVGNDGVFARSVRDTYLEKYSRGFETPRKMSRKDVRYWGNPNLTADCSEFN